MTTDIGIRRTLDLPYEDAITQTTAALTLAHRALTANLDVGLLLPCNVTVYEGGAGSVVTAVDPLEMLRGLAADPATHAVAVEAGTKLRRAIEQITG